MIDMLFWGVNLSSFDKFVWKKNVGSNGLKQACIGKKMLAQSKDIQKMKAYHWLKRILYPTICQDLFTKSAFSPVPGNKTQLELRVLQRLIPLILT